MRSFVFLCVAVTGCAHLPATGAPATGEPLAVHAENVTHTWTSNDKVAEVKHKDENGNVIGTSDVYAEREHQATVLEWFPQQGNSRVDDRDFFNISGDVASFIAAAKYNLALAARAAPVPETRTTASVQ